MKHFDAPWSTSLKVISLLTSVICLGIAGTLVANGNVTTAIFPIGLLFGAAAFTVREYTVSTDSIIVRRLFSQTVFPISNLLSAEFDSDAMKSSLRICGNGGLFSFSGFFSNKSLGRYRALVTDPRRSVILRYPDRRVVVSPSAPEEFVSEVLKQAAEQAGDRKPNLAAS